MPGKIKVKVLAGRNLPVMDRASDTTDAFVEIKFGSVTHKTDVCRKSLNPHWNNTEWYRFEVDESELQDEPLQLRLMDHDTYSANDAIGKVVISLAPLLAREANNAKGTGVPPGAAVLSGWIPVFDTMHGIRGELNVIVKVELFSDFNKYKTSSCGVQFFHCSSIPHGYKATAVHGFVEELVVNDDPEYQWIDKIRTPRASNEARQVAFIKLSNQVQRLVGLKAAELGANAVVGYQQDFDLEGEAGVVARAIGTAVSITPPPTPSQSISIPPCTQQQLRKYLDILATGNESITDLNQYFKNHPDELQKFLSIMIPKTPALLDEPEIIEDDEKSVLTRQSSIKSYTGSLSIYQDEYASQKSLKHIADDQTDLNKLLKRNEDSDSDSSGPLQKMKKIKTHFFTKRFGSMRSRKSDKQDDQVSLRSNSSDTSRISITDIKNEFKKFKRMKKPKFRKTFANKEDEGIGMASILARSVIHAHTSLACIAETQDSEHSPCSTMRRTSESKPTTNVSDDDASQLATIDNSSDDKAKSDIKVNVSEVYTSLKNINVSDSTTAPLQRKLSESCPATPMVERNEHLLKLPAETSYYGSVSLSGDSSDVYTSSDEDDESSDQKTDTEKSVETTSSVVQSVLNNGVDPALIAQMDRKLSILDNTIPELIESTSHDHFVDYDQKHNNIIESSKLSACVNENDKNEIIECGNVLQASTDSEKDKITFSSLKSMNSNHFKFYNPFAHKKVSESISAPTSPVENKGFMYRSSNRIKSQISKISNSNMMKSLSHYSLNLKKKHPAAKTTLSQPGSTSDVPSKVPSHETVLGSPFLSYADLLTLDKEGIDAQKLSHKSDDQSHSKVTMYIGSEPASRASLSGPSFIYREEARGFDGQKSVKGEKLAPKSTGLVHTAMETILIDKVQSLLVPTSPDSVQSKEKQFFDDVHYKLEKMEEAQNQLEQLNIKQNVIKSENTRASDESFKREGLVHTAMETILLDKVQSLLTPNIADMGHRKVDTFFPDFNENMSHIDQRVEEQYKMHGRERSRSKERKERKESLLQTAMKTILIDKVQTLIPTASEPLDSDEVESLCENHQTHTKVEAKPSSRKNSKNHCSLLNTAIETILIDKVQALISPMSEVSPVTSPDAFQEIGFDKGNNDKHDSILHTAMESMLLEKSQALTPPKSESVILNDKQIFEPRKDTSEKSKDNHPELKKSTLESILIKPPVTENIHSDDERHSEPVFKAENEVEIPKDKEHSLLCSALETMLLDKAQAVMRATSEIDAFKGEVPNTDILNTNNFTSEFISSLTDVKSEGLSSKTSTSVSKDHDKQEKKVIRQDSIHSLQELNEVSHKMSKDIGANIFAPSKVTCNKPMLQHFHPILSGPTLETIPSLPEGSLDQTESLDVEGVERSCDCLSECQCHVCDGETNSASVCDNSHAACRFDRNEREKEKCDKEKGSPRHARHESYGGRDPVATLQPMQNSSLNSTSTPMGIHRRSSDSDLSVTPKGGSLNASIGNAGNGGGAILRPSMNSNNLDMLEYPFLTMTEYPPGFIVHIGGTVCARSVKLVDAGGESAARAAWWAELRTELRAHARALRCNAVIAYTESTAICEDVCVLSASGTAAVINLDCDFNPDFETISAASEPKGGAEELEMEHCAAAHVPYSPGTGPYRAELATCGGCRRARVPAVLLATCGKPSKLQSLAKAVTVTAVAARVRRSPPAAEPGARDISDQLPFLEYELHKLLLAKLRMQGANALFCLRTQLAIGERCVMALASGTAVRLVNLPPPTPPRIKASEHDKDALEIQRALWDSFTANKTANGFDIAGSAEPIVIGVLPELDIEEAPVLDLCADKDACVLELDEAEDVETAKSLATRRMHMQVYTNSLKAAPAVPPHAFAQVWRARLAVSSQGGGAWAAAERHVARALDGVAYKLRRLQPCALVAPRFQLELPEDEIQLVVSGAAIQLVDPSKPEHSLEMLRSLSSSPQPSNGTGTGSGSGSNSGSGSGNGSYNQGTGDADDDIFTLDEEQLIKPPQPSEVGDDKNVILNGQVPTMVSLTTLSHVSGSRAARRICALRLLFVRETTAVRELGGLSGFLHTFTCEVLAIARAYTAALGGNALTSFYITQLMLQDNAHKNQGQCLLSVGGDVVHITY